ncbi:diguanylate cyclase [Alteraurantiacibacter aestuarii]
MGPILTGVIWCLFALGTLQLRSEYNAVLIIWLPSAVAVAALHAHPMRQWPGLLLALYIAQLTTSLLIDLPLVNGMALAFATIVEAFICTRIGKLVLGGRGQLPRTFAHIAGLFLAAVAGALASALISFPFRTDPTLPELAWWFLASVLGILAGTPVLLFLRQYLGFGDQKVAISGSLSLKGLLLAFLLLVLLADIVLAIPHISLTPLLVIGILAIAIRFGQLGAAWGIIAYGVAATVRSLGGHNPAAFLDFTPFNAGLYLQALMLVMLAASLPLAALLLSRDKLEETLRRRNEALHQNLTIFNLAETLAGIGRWRYDLRKHTQDWSERMLEMNGLPRELAPDPGDVRDSLPDRGKELFGQIARHRDDRKPYDFHYRVRPGGGEERTLHISILNEFDDSGARIALFAVAMDVTQQVRREEAIELARGRAVQLAAEANRRANTDPLTGLPNRRCTLNRLGRLVDNAHRGGSSLAVLMFDIDHFKAVNDGHGHRTGDEVLIRVAQLASCEVRGADLVGRIGGEEFVWLLPGVDQNRAGQLAERLRSAIETGSALGGLPMVTVSIGISSLRPGEDADAMLARADSALYRAKEGGRNRVRLAA